MAVHRDLLRYAPRSSHVCLAQLPSDTPALRRLGLWVHQRELDDSRRTLPSAKRKPVDGTCFLRLDLCLKLICRLGLFAFIEGSASVGWPVGLLLLPTLRRKVCRWNGRAFRDSLGIALAKAQPS